MSLPRPEHPGLCFAAMQVTWSHPVADAVVFSNDFASLAEHFVAIARSSDAESRARTLFPKCPHIATSANARLAPCECVGKVSDQLSRTRRPASPALARRAFSGEKGLAGILVNLR